MNDPAEHDPVASLLQALQPAAPSDELMQRLSAARPIPRTVVPRRAKIVAFIPQISMAAALIALAGAVAWKFLPAGPDELIADTQPVAPSPAGASVLAVAGGPVQSRQRLLGVKDLGVTTRDAEQRPVRFVQARWLDDQTVIQPGGAPPVRQERVREEIVPVVVHTY